MWRVYLISWILWDNNDVSLNMISSIKKCHLIFVEEIKIFELFLRDNDIVYTWKVIQMSFDSSKHFSSIKKLLLKNASIWIFESSGTPCFIDPGADIIDYVHSLSSELNIDLVHIPWWSALTAAISLSGFYINSFVFWWFFSSNFADILKKNDMVHVFFIRHEDVFKIKDSLLDKRNNFRGNIFLWINLAKIWVPFQNTCFRWGSEDLTSFLDIKYKEFREIDHVPDMVIIFDNNSCD